MHHLQRPSRDCARPSSCWKSCVLSLLVLLLLSCCLQVLEAAATHEATFKGSYTGSGYQRHLQQQSSGTSVPNNDSLFAPPLLPVSSSSAYPFSAVGQLANGCSAFLISPCHVMTVAHCVVEPHRKIWYPGLEFYPGRNVQPDNSGWSPLGSAAKAEVLVSPGWLEGPDKGQPHQDYAVIQLDKRLGDQHGWLQVGVAQEQLLQQGLATTEAAACDGKQTSQPPQAATQGAVPPRGDAIQYSRPAAPGRRLRQQQQQQQQQQQAAAQAGSTPPTPQIQDTTTDPSPVTNPHQLLTNIGYPDNQRNGSMWVGYCQQFAWRHKGAMLWHGCSTRGGNSGSPLFISQRRGNNNNTSSSSSNSSSSEEQGLVAVALGLHVAALKQPVNVPAARLAAADMSAVVHASACSSRLYSPCHQLSLTSLNSTGVASGKDARPWWYQQLMPAVQEQLVQPAAQQQLQGLQDSSGCGGTGNTRPARSASEPLLEAGVVHEPVAVAFTPELQSWVQRVLNNHTCGG